MADYEDSYITRFGVTGQSGVASAFGANASGANQAAGAYGKLQGIMRGIGTAAIAVGPQMSQLGDRMMQAAMANREIALRGEAAEHNLEALGKLKGYSPEATDSVKKMAREMVTSMGIFEDTSIQTAALMESFNMTPGEITKLLPAMAAQGKLTGKSLEEIGNMVGKAFSTGNYAMLKRQNITLSEGEVAALKAARALELASTGAGKLAAHQTQVDIITKALTDNTVPLSEQMVTAKDRAMRLDATLELLRDRMGQGVVQAKEYGDILKYNLITHLGGGNESLMKFAGGAEYVGGALLKGGGQVGSMVMQYKTLQAMLALGEKGKRAMGAATVLDSAAEAGKVGIAGREGRAITEGTVAFSERAEALIRAKRETEAAAAATAALKGEGAGWAMGGWGKQVIGRAPGTGLMGTMTGGLGFGKMLGLGGGSVGQTVGAGGLLSGAYGAGAALSSVTLVAGSAVLGWEAGSAIARALNIGGAGDLAKAKKEQAELETAIGGKVGDAITKGMLERNKAEMFGTGPTPRQRAMGVTPTGDLRVTIPGSEVLTRQAARDYSALR